MTDFGAQVRAALQSIRTSEPHDQECIVLSQARFSGGGHEFGVACNCTWQQRVDARLAACVQAAIEATFDATCPRLQEDGSTIYDGLDFVAEAGLAAFLAAAQEI